MASLKDLERQLLALKKQIPFATARALPVRPVRFRKRKGQFREQTGQSHALYRQLCSVHSGPQNQSHSKGIHQADSG
jgi:hypothetical protein